MNKTEIVLHVKNYKIMVQYKYLKHFTSLHGTSCMLDI
jgi:hypothetical protein